MPTLSDLYDADKRHRDPSVQAALVHHPLIPHPLHGVPYADGVLLCGRTSCGPCRDYRASGRQGLDRVTWTRP